MSRQGKPGYVVVTVRRVGDFDRLTYCGHKHLSLEAATRCRDSWRRRTAAPLYVAESER